MQAKLKAIKKAHGAKELGVTTVDMCMGGMRGIPVSPHTYITNDWGHRSRGSQGHDINLTVDVSGVLDFPK